MADLRVVPPLPMYHVLRLIREKSGDQYSIFGQNSNRTLVDMTIEWMLHNIAFYSALSLKLFIYFLNKNQNQFFSDLFKETLGFDLDSIIERAMEVHIEDDGCWFWNIFFQRL